MTGSRLVGGARADGDRSLGAGERVMLEGVILVVVPETDEGGMRAWKPLAIRGRLARAKVHVTEA